MHAEITVRGAFDEAVLQRQADGETPLPVVLIGTGVQAAEYTDEVSGRWPGFRCLYVETGQPATLEAVPATLLEVLGLVTVQLLERPSADADRLQLMIRQATEVSQLAERAGASSETVKGARVWGRSVPRPGQAVSLVHLVEAADCIYLQS